MNERNPNRRLREEFEKPPTPQLKPKEHVRYSSEKRLLPGRPSFGGSSPIPSVKTEQPKKVDIKQAQKAELQKQISLEEVKFQQKQNQEIQLRKKQLFEKQAPERFSIQNEKTEIAERVQKKRQSAPAQMLYGISRQQAKDEQRVAALELREKELDQEFSDGVNEFQKNQDDERLRFAEVIQFYRNEGELTINHKSSESSHANDNAQAHSIQRSEGREAR